MVVADSGLPAASCDIANWIDSPLFVASCCLLVAIALALCPAGCPEDLFGALVLRRGRFGPRPRPGRHPPIFRFSAHPSRNDGRWPRCEAGNLLLVNLAMLGELARPVRCLPRVAGFRYYSLLEAPPLASRHTLPRFGRSVKGLTDVLGRPQAFKLTDLTIGV